MRAWDEDQHGRLRLRGHAGGQHRQHLRAHVDADPHLRLERRRAAAVRLPVPLPAELGRRSQLRLDLLINLHALDGLVLAPPQAPHSRFHGGRRGLSRSDFGFSLLRHHQLPPI